MEMMDLCLRNVSMKIDEVDCLAVTAGPGSFTGLRVGLSTIKGIAYALQKPVVAVSTLLSIAWMLPFHEGYVCPLLDARKKEVYAAIYQWEKDDFKIVLNEGAYKIDEVLKHVDAQTVFIGDGLKVYKDVVSGALGKRAVFAPWNMAGGLPSNVARIAVKKAEKGEYADIVALVPEYYRKAEAEIKFG